MGSISICTRGRPSRALCQKRTRSSLEALLGRPGSTLRLSLHRRGVGLHELSATLFAPIDFGGFQHYSWVILYGTVCAVVGLIYLPFVRGLPPGYRGRIILSGAIFLFGVLGLESIEGYCYAYSLKECRLVSVVFEESAEIVGLTLFLVTLFALLTRRASAVTMGLTQN